MLGNQRCDDLVDLFCRLVQFSCQIFISDRFTGCLAKIDQKNQDRLIGVQIQLIEVFQDPVFPIKIGFLIPLFICTS